GSLEYDPRRDTFRGWLFTIVRNKLRDFHDRPHRLYQGSGDSRVQRLLENTTAPEADEVGEWEREDQGSLVGWAAGQVRPCVQETTWQAFWQRAGEGRSGKEVARSLGVTPAAVYLAKSRVMARLRAVVREVREEE